MSPYKPGKQIDDVKEELGLAQIYKLASNENPFGYSKQVDETVKAHGNHFEIYPDGYATELRQVLSSDLNIDPDQLIFGCGSDEVIDIICRTYIDEDSETIMATPTFPQYKHNALIQGAKIIEVPLVDGYHDLASMLAAITEKTKVVWLCTPNNPTGCLIAEQALKDFLTNCPKHVVVVLDEAYYEYIIKDQAPNSLALVNEHANLIVLRTFSKAYGLAGLRIGYGIAALPISDTLNIARGPFNTTQLAQKAAVAAYQDQAFISYSYEETLKNKNSFKTVLDELGLSYYDSETNFLFVKLPVSGDLLFEYLLTQGFIVRSGEALGHPNGVRITIGTKEQMALMQEAMKTFITKHTGTEQS